MNLNKDIDNKYILDWIELYIVLEWNISKTDILWEFTNLDEDYIEDLFFKLGNRLFLYWDEEPYQINWDFIESNFLEENHKKESYKFSLFLSVYWNWFKTNEWWKLFERLSNEAFKKYLWWESKVFWFPDWLTWWLSVKIDELAIDINEKRWNQNPSSSAKDAKLDLVSYKTIDSRENKLIFLVQSAAWQNWKSKLREISIERWRNYINFWITPIRWFSTSVFIDNKNDFYERWMEWGLIFDRARIFRFISQLTDFYDLNLNNDLVSWNRAAINNFS